MTNVAALRTFSVDNTVSLDRTSAKSAPDSETTSEQERTATEHKGTADPVASGALVTGVPPVVEDQKPVVTEVDSRGAVTGPPVATTPTSPKDAVKLPEKAVDSGKATGVDAGQASRTEERPRSRGQGGIRWRSRCSVTPFDGVRVW